MNNLTSTDKRREEAQLIEHMLSEIESDLEQKGRENTFIESLREQFDERKTLSDKQVDALRKFYDNV
jgi:hypothetical protein